MLPAEGCENGAARYGVAPGIAVPCGKVAASDAGALERGGGVSAPAPTTSPGKRVPGIVGPSESLLLWSRSSIRNAQIRRASGGARLGPLDQGKRSPQVVEGNSRTQHSDMLREYTPETPPGKTGLPQNIVLFEAQSFPRMELDRQHRVHLSETARKPGLGRPIGGPGNALGHSAGASEVAQICHAQLLSQETSSPKPTGRYEDFVDRWLA